MATNKNTIGVNLAFSADTSKVKAQLQDLQNQLSLLLSQTSKTSGLSLDKDLQKANVTIATLKSQLESATNAAGKLDLTKFNKSLKDGKITIEDYKNTLVSLGPNGAQAFSMLAQSVLNAEVPLKRTNALMDKFWDGLKRTAGWQIQSTMIHKFTGAIQQAYGYAQDLNESLTNIRIVTGQSTNEMSKFAKEANKAAKELSTTTTSYTDAALIFYQQGLTGDAVKERTDTVIKMSNVTGQSAEEVSSYMTAIWNNFDDGSKSLEHYADVITALGAATASSSEEIAEGLEKFAAIGSTVGLSYEYATSALATVVAQTRQSADTVGTAFKTLFARIQDLEVGKTLDDGTTLGKYSQALESIGVNIKDATGQVKDMDVILDEMGNKWKTIDKNTQIAVAQAVAGTRQYAQLVALMDNYDAFKNNVNIAENSSGALQQQADIYAESWEAAQKRVRASLEEVYSKILDDKFFINFTNNIAKLIKFIGDLIDSLGGVQGVLLTISTLFMQKFKGKIVESIQNVTLGIKSLFGATQKNAEETRTKVKEALKSMYADSDNPIQKTIGQNYAIMAKAQDTLLAKSRGFTEEQLKIAQILMDEQKTLVELANEEGRRAAMAQEESSSKINSTVNSVIGSINSNEGWDNTDKKDAAQEVRKAAIEFENATSQAERFNSVVNKTFKNGGKDVEGTRIKLKLLASTFDENETSLEKVDAQLQNTYGKDGAEALIKFQKTLKNETLTEEQLEQAYNELANTILKVSTSAEQAQSNFENIGKRYQDVGFKVNELVKALKEGAISEEEFRRKTMEATGGLENLETGLDKIPPKTFTIGQAIVTLASTITSVMSAFSSINGLIDKWYEDDEQTSVGDKIIATLTTLGIVITMLAPMFTGLVGAKAADTAATIANTLANWGLAVSTGAVQAAMAAFLVVLLAVMAAVIAIVAIYKAWRKSLQDTADASKRVADSQKELTEQYKKENEEIKSLKTSYDDLLKQYEDGQIGAETLRQKSYELCMQYGQESLALKALSGDYQSLSEAMKDLESASAKQVAQSAEEAKKKYNTAIYDQILSSAGSRIDNGNTIDLKGMVWRNDEDKKLAYELEQLGIKFLDSDHIDLQSYVDAIEKDADAVKKVLNNSNTKAASQLRKYWSDITDQVDGLTQSTNDAKEAQKTLIINAQNFDAIKSISDYNKTLRTMVHDALSAGVFDSIEDATKWANAYMSAIDSVKEYAQTSTIVSSMSSTLEAIKTNKEKAQTAIDDKRNEIDDKNASARSNTGHFLGSTYTHTNAFTGKQSTIVNGSEGLLTFKNNDSDYYKWFQKQGYSIKTDNAGAVSLWQNGEFVKDIDSGGYAIQQNQDKLTNLDNFNGGEFISNKVYDILKDKYEAFNENIFKTYEDKYINKYFDTVDQLTEYLGEKYGQAQQILFSQLDDVFAEELKKTNGDINEAAENLLKTHDKIFENAGKASASSYLQGIAEGLISGEKTLSKDEIKKVLSQDIDWTQLGTPITEDTLDNMDYGSQATASLMAQSEALKEQAENGKEAAEQATKLANAYRDAHKAELEKYETAEADLDLLARNAGVSKEVVEQLRQANEAGIDYKDIGLAEEYKKLEIASKNCGKEIDSIDVLFENTSGDVKKVKKQMDNYDNIVSQVTVTSEDYEAQIKDVNDAQEKANKIIDKVQFAYKTLNSSMEDYTKNGYFSMDNLQSILELEPRYLQALKWDGQQFSLNKQALVEMTKAKLADMAVNEATLAYDQIQIEIDNAKTKGLSDKVKVTNIDTAATLNLAESKLRDAEASIADAVATRQLTKAQAEELRQYLKIERTKIAAIGDTYSKVEEQFKGIMLGSDAANKASKKYFEDEFDRYWEFKKAIEAVEHELSKLEEQQSNLYGQELIDNLNQVNALLVQQKVNYEALAEAQREEADELRNTLSKYGAEFGEDGGLTNYAAVTTSMFNKYSGKEESKEYEEFKKALERFDTLFYSEMVDTADKATEASRKVIENNLKIWETDIQINLDLKQAERDWDNFLKEINRNFKSTFSDAGQEIEYALKKVQTFNLNDGTLASDIQKVENINYEINQLKNGGTSDLFSSLSEAENALKEANKTLQDDAEELFSTYKEGWNSYLEYIDDVGTHLDNINKKYEELNEELEHQANLISLLYGDTAYDKLAKLYDTQQKSNLAQLKSLRQQTDFYQAQYEKAVQLDGEDSKSAEKWLEKKKQAMQDLRAEEETYIKTIQSKYNNTIDSIIKKARMATNGGVDTDWARTMYELTKTKSEGNYDDVERVYQLTSLQSKWNKLIADTTGTKNQEKLKKIMDEQLANLEKKATLTEYDIGLAEKALAVEQARIALEQAQNSKDSMKLTRNVEGNWSYQYVADEDNIAEKQQDLLDAINDKYEYVKSANQQALDDLLQYEEDFWNKYAEIMKDVSLSDEERQSRIAQLYDMYYGEEGILTQAYQDSAQTQQDLNLITAEQLWTIYESDQEKYATMTAAEQELIDGLKNGTIKSYEDIQEAGQRVNDESLDYWNTTAQAMADAWNADDGMSIKSQVNEALKDCSTALADYGADVDAGCAAAGEDFTDVGNAIDDVSNAIDDLNGTTEDYIDNTEKLIDDYIDSLKELESQWKEVKSIVEQNIDTMKKYELATNNATAAYNSLNAAKSSSEDSENGGNSTDIADNNPLEETVHYYSVDSSPDGNGLVVTVYEKIGNSEKAIGLDGEEAKDHKVGSVWEARDYINQVLSENGYDEELDPEKNVQTSGYKYYLDNARVNTYSFDTGGYTGEWDNSGRLAVLHQKELVLNKDDTENILNAVEFVRGIASSIGASLLSQLAVMTNATSSIRPVGADYLSSNVNNASNNNVYNVTAEFPNAESVQDIREALLSLPNLVSQKVNEKNI